MTSFVLYILAVVISIQYVSSVPPDPATAPAVDQQVDTSNITPIDTVSVANEVAPVTPAVQEPVAQAAPTTPVCDGSQVIYATPPSQDTITGMPNGPGLDAITLSNDGINTFLSNKIGIASNMFQIIPDQLVPEREIIRSGSINPLTNDLVLLYQEIDPMDPTMTEPNQRLIIIPGFKLNSLLVESQSPALSQTAAAGVVGGAEAVAPGLEQQLPQAQRPGILAFELEQEIDLSEVEVGDQIPLTEIAFDCAGNLLGITLEGELVQIIIEAGNSNLDMDYIGRVQFQGPIVELSQGFVGLTYDFQTNAFVAVGGLMGKTLVQFQVAECTVFQIGNPIIITDNDNLCPQGIVSIAARGDNQYYVTCVDTAVGPMAMGLAVLELQGGTATILPLNAAQGQTLVPLPNSSGGAIIPSIPSTTGNSICFPRSIQSTPPTCNVLPADTDCQGDIQMQQVFPPPMAAPGASVNGGTGSTGLVPPPGAQITVGAAPVNGQVGGIPQVNSYGTGSYGGYGSQGGYNRLEAGGQGQGANGEYGTSFNGAIVPGTDTANAQANGLAIGAGAAAAEGFGSGSASGSGSSSSGSSASSGSTSSGSTSSGSTSSGSTSSGSSGSSGSGSDDDSSSGSGSDDSNDSDDSSGSDDSVSGSGSDDDSDNSGSDDSSDDNSDDSDDSSGTGSGSGADDNNSGSDDDSGSVSDDDDEDESSDNGGSADDNSLDDNGDESDDDDNNASQSSESSEERESADDALSNGNDFNQNGFISAQEYGANGNGQMISLSPSTLANLWGLAMIFLGINVTFLFVCYYRNGNCKKNQVTMDDDMDADIESL